MTLTQLGASNLSPPDASELSFKINTDAQMDVRQVGLKGSSRMDRILLVRLPAHTVRAAQQWRTARFRPRRRGVC